MRILRNGMTMKISRASVIDEVYQFHQENILIFMQMLDMPETMNPACTAGHALKVEIEA